ncbi:MAG: two-component sensor histidine kinase [Lachnospiraceae bacterium]|nr:two-component sensor histidine kinase [Lachnospiraceae bacterium]
MKKKINMQLVVIAVLSILATLVLTGAAFYKLFYKQVFEDLKVYSVILEKEALLGDWEKEGSVSDDVLRITLIGQEGNVIYDNTAEIATMENHKERTEIARAMEKGEGKAVRESATLGKSTFYYARLLEDGNVLRVAKEAKSLWSVFGNAVPLISLIVATLLISCLIMAHLLTESLIAPVEQMAKNLDAIDEIETYEELQPFVAMIKKQHEDIVKSVKVRQEFTANVTHELKTPLTSISGYAELIETGMASDADVVKFAKGIHKNSNRLLSLINDIIRLSELDSSSGELVFEKINLYTLAQTCVDMLQFNADKHNVSLHLMGQESYVSGDKQMLEEVLYNLCENAIRYNNENGSVIVTVLPEGEKTLLIVEDTGIGIPKESQERVFERFYRVDKSRSKSTGGTGLGLAIVKHITIKHGAEIQVESEVGKGTKITVTFN